MIEPIVIRGKTFIPEKGAHDPDGKACVMEMAAWLGGERWSDHPSCASPVIGAFCRSFWDSSPDNWPGLLERIDRIAGSANPAADEARAWLATDWLVRTFTPVWLRKAGLTEQATALEALPELTSTELAKAAQPIIDGARDKAYAAWDAARDAAGDAARAAAWDAAWDAARDAAWDAARAAARAAAGAAAWDAAGDAARAAAGAAARDAARAAARDAAKGKKGYSAQYNAAYKAARSVLDVALTETVTELRASAFDLLDRMLGSERPQHDPRPRRPRREPAPMSHAMDRVLEEVGWITARQEMVAALGDRSDLAPDWIDRLTEQAIAFADEWHLPFDKTTAALVAAARLLWPEAFR